MNQLPAHLQRYQSRDLGSTLSQNLGANAPPYVSIAGGRFTLIDAAGNEQPGGGFDQTLGVYIDACIIDVNDHISRVFYEKDYDPSAATFSPPDCWSDNGVGPSTACSKPQAPTCASCQWAVWGSATSAQGKAIPACQQVQKLALLVPAFPQVVFLLRVPPNSHKNLRAYNELSKGNKANISDLLTRIYFDRTTQGTLLFKPVSWIDEGVAQAREAAYVEKKTDALVGRTDVPRQALAAPQQFQQIAPPNTTGQAPLLSTQPGSTMQTPVRELSPYFPQEQAPGPFVLPAASAPIATAPASATANPTAPAASPSSQMLPPNTMAGAAPAAPPQRRRRRTAAEMQAAQTPAAAQPSAAQPAAPQAPFPVSSAPGSLPGQTDMGFGMAQGQPAAANPEVQQALDSFFAQ